MNSPPRSSSSRCPQVGIVHYCWCEDGASNPFEVVVKFRGKEMDVKAQIAELVTAQLADALGLQVPQAAVVDVPAGFDAIIAEKDLAAMVKSSPGPNFGSVNLGAGFTTWPPGRNLVGAQRDQAADIFAFDTLIQNPDRRAVNPNLWARSDKLGVTGIFVSGTANHWRSA